MNCSLYSEVSSFDMGEPQHSSYSNVRVGKAVVMLEGFTNSPRDFLSIFIPLLKKGTQTLEGLT